MRKFLSYHLHFFKWLFFNYFNLMLFQSKIAIYLTLFIYVIKIAMESIIDTASISNVLNPMLLLLIIMINKAQWISLPYLSLDQSTRNPNRLVSTCQLHMLALKHKTNIKLVIWWKKDCTFKRYTPPSDSQKCSLFLILSCESLSN